MDRAQVGTNEQGRATSGFPLTKNRMTRQAQYWANDYENPFAIITYTYNELGQHITTVESYSDFFDPSVFTEANKNVYEYNAKGQITNIKRYSVNEGQYELANTEEFDYDAST